MSINKTKKSKTKKSKTRKNNMNYNTNNGILFSKEKHQIVQNIDTPDRKNYIKELQDTLKSSHMLERNDIKNDFYTYINVDWLSKTEKELEKEKNFMYKWMILEWFKKRFIMS